MAALWAAWIGCAGALGWVPNQAGVWPAEGLPVPYCIAPEAGRTDLSADQVEADMEAAISVWEAPEAGGSLACTGFRMERRTSGTCERILDPGDPVVSFYFEPDWDLPETVLGYTLSRVRLDRTCGTAVDDTGTPHELPCRVGTDVALNDAHGFWSRDPAEGASVQTVVAHEVGHLLGLGHCEENQTCRPGEALMFGRYSPMTRPELQDDDAEGACALYPRTALPFGYACDGDGECLSQVCAGGRCTRTCQGGDCPDDTVCRTEPAGRRTVCLPPRPPAAAYEPCGPDRDCLDGLVCQGVCVPASMPDAGGSPDGGVADAGRTFDGGMGSALRGPGGDRLPPLTGSCQTGQGGGSVVWLAVLALARWGRARTGGRKADADRFSGAAFAASRSLDPGRSNRPQRATAPASQVPSSVWPSSRTRTRSLGSR